MLWDLGFRFYDLRLVVTNSGRVQALGRRVDLWFRVSDTECFFKL